MPCAVVPARRPSDPPFRRRFRLPCLPCLPKWAGPACCAGLLALAATAVPPARAQQDSGGSEARAARSSGPPLARFALPDDASAVLNPLLQRVLDTRRWNESADPDDDERRLRRLRDSAVDVMATEGYFLPRISVEEDATGAARYVMRVEPGPRARVATVELEFRGPIGFQTERLATLRKGWELQEGQPFRDAVWSTSKSRLLARVQERDFPTATIVESEAEVDVDTSSVLLRVVIESGPAFTLGPLQVSGLQRYDMDLVERFNEFKVGEPYDATKLLEFQRRLQSGPYFAGVQVDAELDPTRPNEVPIIVKLREAPSKRISTGIGFSTNTGARVEATYRQVGIFGRPYTLQTGVGIDEKRQIGYADILLPPKPNGARDSFGVLGEHTDISGVITDRYAAGVARDYTRTSEDSSIDTRLSLSLQRETEERCVPLPSNQEVCTDQRQERVNDTLILAYTWTRRTVDSITDPRRGDVITLRVAPGLGRVGNIGDVLGNTFVHLYGRYVRYIPVFQRDQIILRGEAGHVVADDLLIVPLEYRFRAGGAGSVRGYSYQSLGLRQGDAVIGSRSLAVGSVEYVKWFTETWGGAAFYDVGDADNELLKIRWARGYGLGVRYRTVAGPLALDVAYGERDKKWRPHFTIAISF